MTVGEKMIWATAFVQTRSIGAADSAVETYRRYLEFARHPHSDIDLRHKLILEFARDDENVS
jgi:hypothetical protein